LASDASNCGACGTDCNANGTGVCTSGQCSYSSCNPGLNLCGNACANLTSDLNNCGGCGNVCPQVPNSTATCETLARGGARCKDFCNSGFTSCPSACASLPSDPNNCGACGNVCATGQQCFHVDDTGYYITQVDCNCTDAYIASHPASFCFPFGTGPVNQNSAPAGVCSQSACLLGSNQPCTSNSQCGSNLCSPITHSCN
jgi:hypothetical protein